MLAEANLEPPIRQVNIYQWRYHGMVPWLQKVGTAGTGSAGKQSDLRGRRVYFLHIPIHFLLWHGKAKYILRPWMVHASNFEIELRNNFELRHF